MPEVLVIGGGVSGCACAAVLASKGIAVTVVNSALDGIGQPGYGPVVTAGKGGWERIVETLQRLPPLLRDVWIDAAEVPETATGSSAGVGSDHGVMPQKEAFFVVDRRTVSVEAKRNLETLPGLRLRQGLAEAVTIVRDGEAGNRSRVAVETAFGEVFEGDAVVVAVGLALGGRVHVGRDVLPGGRYGETPADGLKISLEELGAEFVESRVDVGPRFCGTWAWRGNDSAYSGSGEAAVAFGEGFRRMVTVGLRALPDWEKVRGGSNRREHGRGEGPDGGACGGPAVGFDMRRIRGNGWSDDFPESPHRVEGLRMHEVVVGRGVEDESEPLLAPDGVATGEVHARCGAMNAVTRLRGHGRDGRGRGGYASAGALIPVASRLEHHIVGLKVTNLGGDGRLQTPGGAGGLIWVAGRAGGARDYLASLASGVAVADGIACWVAREAARDEAVG
ncbi:MAG: FAD-dependent oxidoreductase [Thermoleophilia bacterium]|nr:FAD-dependent oxidoreductase [Thermoleophilia bacterium]